MKGAVLMLVTVCLTWQMSAGEGHLRVRRSSHGGGDGGGDDHDEEWPMDPRTPDWDRLPRPPKGFSYEVEEARLADGNSTSGRLEVKINDEWGTVCSDGFTWESADLFCRQLGFRAAFQVWADGTYNAGSGTILLDGVRCHPHVPSFEYCCSNQLKLHDCQHSQDVAIDCTNNPDYRPRCCMGAEVNSTEARRRCVMCGPVGMNGTNTTDGSGGDRDGSGGDRDGSGGDRDSSGGDGGKDERDQPPMPCGGCHGNNPGWPSQGGYPAPCGGGMNGGGGDSSGQGDRPDPPREEPPCAWEDCRQCTDEEMPKPKLPRCPPMPNFGGRLVDDMRLVGGDGPHKGILEVVVQDETGTVCDDTVTWELAKIVCSHLGFREAVGVVENTYGAGSGRVLLGGIRCPPRVKRLRDCCMNDLGVVDASCSDHGRDVVIECTNSTEYKVPCCDENNMDRRTCRAGCHLPDMLCEDGDRPPPPAPKPPQPCSRPPMPHGNPPVGYPPMGYPPMGYPPPGGVPWPFPQAGAVVFNIQQNFFGPVVGGLGGWPGVPGNNGGGGGCPPLPPPPKKPCCCRGDRKPPTPPQNRTTTARPPHPTGPMTPPTGTMTPPTRTMTQTTTPIISPVTNQTNRPTEPTRTTPTTTTTTTTRPPGPPTSSPDASFQCDFETDCSFEPVVSERQWTLNQGKTGSSGTGPETDHTLGTDRGSYVYLETTSTNAGDRAILRTQRIQLTNSGCLEFYYHMFGEHVSSLRVALSSGTVLFEENGDKGDVWLRGTSPLPGGFVQVDFIANSLGQFRGDIALDDIRISNGVCPP